MNTFWKIIPRLKDWYTSRGGSVNGGLVNGGLANGGTVNDRLVNRAKVKASAFENGGTFDSNFCTNLENGSRPPVARFIIGRYYCRSDGYINLSEVKEEPPPKESEEKTATTPLQPEEIKKETNEPVKSTERQEDAKESNSACEVSRTGTKRKAEVLSKESGKIGVTITTSPPHTSPKQPKMGSPPPPAQTASSPTDKSSAHMTPPKAQTPKPAPVASKASPSPPKPSKKEPSEVTSTAASTTPTSTAPTPSTPASKAMSPAPTGGPTPKGGATVAATPSAKAATPVQSLRHTPAPAPATPMVSTTTASSTNEQKPTATVKQETPTSAAPAEKKKVTNGHASSLVTHILTNPGPEYWRNKNPLADDIVITDVTVNLCTEHHGCICPLLYAPVCASNGQIFSNECLIRCHNLEENDPEVTVVHEGYCKNSPTDMESCICPMIFSPVCASNGQTFSNKCMVNCYNMEHNESKGDFVLTIVTGLSEFVS
ncbi:unnamed protein product [Nesidiocoris tenuis]|uniref:Kazal-like domain-containing protein n=1 Tax=Nesidiocoris tenuis TaxID=355587 RepID=A0A6H5GQV4_9HEMI|nr:unnamed protein product [Nesidiocoris tenuis]